VVNSQPGDAPGLAGPCPAADRPDPIGPFPCAHASWALAGGRRAGLFPPPALLYFRVRIKLPTHVRLQPAARFRLVQAFLRPSGAGGEENGGAARKRGRREGCKNEETRAGRSGSGRKSDCEGRKRRKDEIGVIQSGQEGSRRANEMRRTRTGGFQASSAG